MKIAGPLVAALAAVCLSVLAVPALAQNEIKISHQWQGTEGRDRAVRVSSGRYPTIRTLRV